MFRLALFFKPMFSPNWLFSVFCTHLQISNRMLISSTCFMSQSVLQSRLISASNHKRWSRMVMKRVSPVSTCPSVLPDPQFHYQHSRGRANVISPVPKQLTVQREWVNNVNNGQICEYLHISGHYKEEDSEKDKGEGRHPASARGFRTSFTVEESLEVDFRVCIAVDFQLGRSPDCQLGLCQVSGGLRLKIQGAMGFFTFCLFLRIPWTTRRSNQSIPKEINPEYSLEGLMLKL